MEIGQIVIGTIFGIITILGFIYVSFTIRQKGPILSNSYIWLSKEQKEKADKKAEYHLVTVVFSLLSMFCLMETLYILTMSKIFLIIGFCFLVIDMIYAIYATMKGK